MKRRAFIILFLVFAVGCIQKTETIVDNGSCEPLGSDGLQPWTASLQSNQMPVEVGCGYINEPCVAVTICVPGTGTCQTIDHILLDTGSYGLRLFNCNVSLNLPNQYDGAVSTTATTTVGSKIATLGSASGVAVGMVLVDTAVPTSTTITAVNGTQVTLSAAATVSATNSVTINNEIAECVTYADGTGDWGPVMKADVTIGEEVAYDLPIQIINPTYSGGNGCGETTEYSPQVSGFNGIMGVGLLATDCPVCTTLADQGYYACAGGICNGTKVPTGAQVTNPITQIKPNGSGSTAVDTNGSILTLGAVGNTLGASNVQGTLTFGINTTSPYHTADNSTSVTTTGNTSFGSDEITNVASTANLGAGMTITGTGIQAGTVISSISGNTITMSQTATGTNTGDTITSVRTLYQADGYANFVSKFNGTPYSSSFVDSGSNFWDFPDSSIAQCGDNGLFCPSSQQNLSVQGASAGTTSYGTAIDFAIINADAVVENGNNCFNNLGAPFSSGFDWGLPFFYGRSVFVGIDGATATGFGTGPFWAW